MIPEVDDRWSNDDEWKTCPECDGQGDCGCDPPYASVCEPCRGTGRVPVGTTDECPRCFVLEGPTFVPENHFEYCERRETR